MTNDQSPVTDSAMTPERRAEIDERAEKAHQHIGDICAGRARWKMTIPADEERDSDLILSNSLQDVFNLLAEVERVTRERDEALRERDLAIAHDRQPYPTAWAYEQACKTIERMRPVVRAAQEWRDQFARPSTSDMPRKRAVCDSVDAYEAEMDAIAAGLPCDHPERICGRCGGPNVRAWCAPSPLWNQVMRGGDINAADAHGGIVCPVCFAQLAEEGGIAQRWRFYAETVHVELATTTPSGRVWNAQTWLWEEPAAPSVDGGEALACRSPAATAPGADPCGALAFIRGIRCDYPIGHGQLYAHDKRWDHGNLGRDAWWTGKGPQPGTTDQVALSDADYDAALADGEIHERPGLAAQPTTSEE